ncbi:MAG: chloride channel protein [Sumerlaeia bacterium]
MSISQKLPPFWDRGRLQEWFISLRNDPDRSDAYLFVLAVVVGLVMGLVSTLFRWLIETSHHLFHGTKDASGAVTSQSLLHYLPNQLEGPVTIFLPAFGGLIVGLVIYKFLKLSGGHGVPSVMKAVSTGEVYLSPSMAVKSMTSPITIASGGSSGPEGPIVEIGAVIGSTIGRFSRIRKDQVGTLVGCGAAAGIAAIFAAPIGGVIFALELIMRDFQVRKFAPIVVAAVMAAVTSSALLPNDPVFPPLTNPLLQSIQPSIVLVIQFGFLGVLCALVGALLVRSLYVVHDFFHGIRIPMWMKPMFGGVLVGMIGIFYPDILGEGYESVNTMIFNNPLTSFNAQFLIPLVLLCLLKIMATSITLGSGGTGGTFAPAMVSGALVGAAVGTLSNLILPGFSPDYRIFALVGMAGVVSSALGTPLASLLIIYEVSGGHYRLMLPLMITVAISSLASQLLSQGSVYTTTLLRDGFDMVEQNRRKNDPLNNVLVEEIMTRSFYSFRPNDSLNRILEVLANTDEEAFVVSNEKGMLHGVISIHDLRAVATLGDLGTAAVIAGDLANGQTPVLYKKSPAIKAMEIFTSSDVDGIPIIESDESRKVIAMVYRSAMLKAYSYKAESPST